MHHSSSEIFVESARPLDYHPVSPRIDVDAKLADIVNLRDNSQFL
jgi:hypothetical protein